PLLSLSLLGISVEARDDAWDQRVPEKLAAHVHQSSPVSPLWLRRGAFPHHLQQASTVTPGLHDFLALEIGMQPVQALLPAILVAAIEFLCWNRLRLGSKPRLNQRQEGPFGVFFQSNVHQRTG